jgi:hypothetical protein
MGRLHYITTCPSTVIIFCLFQTCMIVMKQTVVVSIRIVVECSRCMSVPHSVFTTHFTYINAVLKSRNLIIVGITITTIFNAATQVYSKTSI